MLPSITKLLVCQLPNNGSCFFISFFFFPLLVPACSQPFISPWKFSGDLYTPIPPGIRPVTHLYLSEVTSDSVSVAWSAPAPPADLFILSYSSSDGTDTSKVTLEGFKTRSLVQGLLPSTPYTISLITIQGDVTSEPITASLTTGELLENWGRTQPSIHTHKQKSIKAMTLYEICCSSFSWWLHITLLDEWKECVDPSVPTVLKKATFLRLQLAKIKHYW